MYSTKYLTTLLSILLLSKLSIALLVDGTFKLLGINYDKKTHGLF